MDSLTNLFQKIESLSETCDSKLKSLEETLDKHKTRAKDEDHYLLMKSRYKTYIDDEMFWEDTIRIMEDCSFIRYNSYMYLETNQDFLSYPYEHQSKHHLIQCWHLLQNVQPYFLHNELQYPLQLYQLVLITF